MELPLFPLHLVLFPGGTAPLQVFEPRYREMLERVLREDRRFGVVAIRRGMEVGGPAETFDVGCIGEVTRVQRAPEGAMQILVEGRERFVIVERRTDTPYPMAEVEALIEQEGDDAADAMPAARAGIRRYLSVVAQLQGTDVLVPTLPVGLVELSFTIASALQLDVHERQALLEAPDASSRLDLAAELSLREALLLEAVGPNVGHPRAPLSMN